MTTNYNPLEHGHTGNPEPVLVCAHCGFDYTRITDVTKVYPQSEPVASGDIADIVLTYVCESCDAVSNLYFGHHKGQTEVHAGVAR